MKRLAFYLSVFVLILSVLACGMFQEPKKFNVVIHGQTEKTTLECSWSFLSYGSKGMVFECDENKYMLDVYEPIE